MFLRRVFTSGMVISMHAMAPRTQASAALCIRACSTSTAQDMTYDAPIKVSAPVELARTLIRRPSITPNDNGLQDLIKLRLERIGFVCKNMNFEDVSNLWAVRGQKKPLLVFCGHTDVVPTGPAEQWTYPPFSGEIDQNGMLHGRGAADMKGGVASFIVACERFVEKHPMHGGSIGLLLTSDEEGPAINGTKRVVEELKGRGQGIDLCIVGEPTSLAKCGDTIKVGRRGSLEGELTVYGKQGHIAYPHLAENPLHLSLGALQALVSQEWDQGNANFPPTTFQISNIFGGTGAKNVIPGHKTIHFNFRYSPETNDAELKEKVEQILTQHKLKYIIEWEEPCYPYETKNREFAEAVRASVRKVSGHDAKICTSGGTSDGRFVATMEGAQVVELGLVGATIHQVDEMVSTSDLEVLASIYEDMLERILCRNGE